MPRRFLAALSFPQRPGRSTVSATNIINRQRRNWTILASTAVLACTALVFASVASSRFTSKMTQIDLVNDTGALVLVAQEFDGRTRLEFKNISAKDLNGFIFGLSNLSEVEIGDRVIGMAEVIKIPKSLLSILAVMYASDQITDHQQENDWIYIGTSKEGVKLSYSPERTVKRGRLIHAWFKGEHPNTDQKISSNISLHEFNCPRGTYRLLQSTLFSRDGSTQSSNQPSAWEHPLPESVAEMELKQVCRKTSSRKNDVR